MKTQAINRLYLLRLVTGITIILFFMSLGLNQLAYGAGSSSSKSSSKSESAVQKRERANEYFEEGQKLQEKWNYKQAAKKYERAIKIDATYAEAYSNLGYCYRKMGKFDEAVRCYKNAIKLKPELAEAHEYLGETYAEMGKFDLAEKELAILRELGSEQAQKLAEFIEKLKKQQS